MIAKMLKYQKITLLFFLMAVLAGYISFVTLEQRENPEITVSTATVTTVYPGASPEKVEQLVTNPLEDKINEMENIKIVTSTSSPNVSVITVELIPGVDYEQSWDTLRQKVQSAESELPPEAEKPEINDDLSKIAQQIIHFVVERPDQLESLRKHAENWQEQLRTVPGVSDVAIVGLPERQIKVTLDMQKLEQFQLPWGAVVQALNNAHDRTPIGTIDEEQKNVYYQLTGEWQNAGDVAETVIFRRSGEGASIKLKDVADVTLSTDKLEQHVFHKGKPALDIVINAEKGVDIPSLQDRIERKIEELKPELPAHVQLVSLFSQKESVHELFSELNRELIIGMIAVTIVCSLGLQFGTAIIVALAIPISIAVGFIPVSSFGIDLNQITIISLVIVLGILVDDAIVVNDNIERRLQLGDSPQTAALEGSKDVAVSILTATIATAAAFFPLFFLEGNIGDFIRPIPVVISLTLAASMVMSLTIIPIFRQWLGERRIRKAGAGIVAGDRPAGFLGAQLQKLSEYYERQIYRFLRKPLTTGLVALAVGTSSFLLLPLLGVQYFPKAERAEMLIDVRMPVGTAYPATVDVVKGISAWVERQNGVAEVSAYAGRTAPKFYYSEMELTGNRRGQIFVKVDRQKIDTADVVNTWRQQLSAMYPEVEIIPRELEQGPPVGAPVAVRISGSDLDELRNLSQQIQGILAEIPGAVNIADDMDKPMPTMELILNKDKANYVGITEKDLTSTLRLASEGIDMMEMQLDDELIDVTLYSKVRTNPLSPTVDGLLIPSQTGQLYDLQQFVRQEPGEMIETIHHRNMTRTVTVRSYTEDRLPDDIMRELETRMATLEKPNGYTIEFGGENEERNEAFGAIGRLSVIVMLLIYIIMAMQFYSLSIPVLILSTVYLAAGGGLIGLFVTGSPIGFMALMGFVSLSGIVVRNGIVLIEFIEQAREKGVALQEAIAQSGRARLRPILLTTATAVGGLMPMTIMGGSLWRPMAVVIISGLIYSTVLTLIVVPSLYMKLGSWREKRKAAKADRSSTPASDTPLHV